MIKRTPRTPRVRLAPDAPFVVGMILADEDGNRTTVTYVTTRTVTVDGGGFSHGFVRCRWPFVITE